MEPRVAAAQFRIQNSDVRRPTQRASRKPSTAESTRAEAGPSPAEAKEAAASTAGIIRLHTPTAA